MIVVQEAGGSDVEYEWRGEFTNPEVNALHAAAFETSVFDDWDWVAQTARHSLGWVTARRAGELVGFVNVPWDGLVHAWIQDTIVAPEAQRQGIGLGLVRVATAGSRAAGCEWLHVDFDEELAPFYIGACGFRPTGAGLIEL